MNTFECPQCGKTKEVAIDRRYKCSDCKVEMVKKERQEPLIRLINNERTCEWFPSINGKIGIAHNERDVDEDFIVINNQKIKRTTKQTNMHKEIDDAVRRGYHVI